jgi:acyl-CoA reductase-like NAD-dependent aldehyde dehydrogenase
VLASYDSLFVGGEWVTGGGRPAGQDRGWFVEPTVFADVDNSDPAAPSGGVNKYIPDPAAPSGTIGVNASSIGRELGPTAISPTSTSSPPTPTPTRPIP